MYDERQAVSGSYSEWPMVIHVCFFLILFQILLRIYYNPKTFLWRRERMKDTFPSRFDEFVHNYEIATGLSVNLAGLGERL